jgi:hypothetical protein
MLKGISGKDMVPYIYKKLRKIKQTRDEKFTKTLTML